MGVNRTGYDGNGLEYIKSSQIINPNGELLSPVISEDEIDILDIDPEYVVNLSKSFPQRRIASLHSINHSCK